MLGSDLSGSEAYLCNRTEFALARANLDHGVAHLDNALRLQKSLPGLIAGLERLVSLHVIRRLECLSEGASIR